MKQNKKIDLFFDGKYIASTIAAKTCKEAKARALQLFQDEVTYANNGYTDSHYAKRREMISKPELLKAYFSK